MTYPNDTAFPCPPDVCHRDVVGLTKREYFAGLALQGILAQTPEHNNQILSITLLAVYAADRLIAELNELEKEKTNE